MAKGKQGNVKRSFAEHGIPMLIPGARRDAILLTENDNMTDYIDASCTVELSRCERGPFGGFKPCTEEFVLDIGSFVGSLYGKSDFHNMVLATKSVAGRSRR